MDLSKLTQAPGAKKKRKRVGRGPGSGNGKTAGRGHKGQKSRSGFSRPQGFEGGQMPINRRLPKRGFFHEDRFAMAVVNVASLEKAFEAGAEITPASESAYPAVSSAARAAAASGLSMPLGIARPPASLRRSRDARTRSDSDVAMT